MVSQERGDPCPQKKSAELGHEAECLKKLGLGSYVFKKVFSQLTVITLLLHFNTLSLEVLEMFCTPYTLHVS